MADTIDTIDTHQTLMDEAYKGWESDTTYMDFLASLPAGHRYAVLLGNMNYQVENGGWSQWIGNGYAEAGDQLLDVLSMMRRTCPLATEVASMVRKAVDVAERAQGGDPWNEYGHYNDRYVEDIYNELDDRAYYAINGDFMKQTEIWLRRTTSRAPVAEETLSKHSDALSRSV